MPLNPLGPVLAMTRETKLGLVVSGSFLGLLAVVLALKIERGPRGDAGCRGCRRCAAGFQGAG